MTELQPRFLAFSKSVIGYCKTLKLDSINRPLVSQLIRSATSIGANYTEAQNGISRKDFRAKIYICQKEAEETKYWLELLSECTNESETSIIELQNEVQQIIKILQAIINKLS